MTQPLPSDPVAEALFGDTRRSVLALLFGRPEEAFYLREIVRETGSGRGAVQRELARLAGAGLVLRSERGREVYFRANPEAPVYGELRNLIEKTTGTVGVLRTALAALGPERVHAAFVYGSVATGSQRSPSDVDLMVIGPVTLRELLPSLGPAQDRLGREINPTIYDAKELRERLDRGDHFVSSVFAGPRLMVVGVARLAGQPLDRRAPDQPAGDRGLPRGRGA
jgi:DNA-binding transcriptional ArsR family regulator